MDPVKVISDGTTTDWTDVDISSYVSSGTITASLRIAEKNSTLGTQVWIRRKGSTSEITPYRLIDSGSIFVETAVNSSYIFQYKTDGVVDIYVTGYFTSTIEPSDVDYLEGETFPVSVSEIIQILNGDGPDGDNNYKIFGEDINHTSISRIIAVTNNYIYLLFGEDDEAWALAKNKTKIKGAIRDFSILRVLATLAGISIPTHYNYTMGGLNIQKPVVSQLKQMIEMYMDSCRRWQKLILTRGIVKKQTDLTVGLINEYPSGSGNTFVSYDASLV